LLESGAIVLHARVKNGKVLWILACTFDGFKKLISRLNRFKLKYKILHKSRFLENYELTFREIEVLRFALESGYFESPKKVKLGELAEMLGVSEATASVMLRKVMRKIAELYVNWQDFADVEF